MTSKLEHLCLVALTGCGAFFLLELGLAVRDIRIHTIPQLTQAATDADRSVIIIGATAGNLERTSREWKAKQDQVAQGALAATITLNSDLTQLAHLLSTGSSLLESQQQSLKSLETTAGQSLTTAGDSVAVLATQMQPVIVNLQNATKNAADASQSLNKAILATSPDVEKTAHDLAATAADGKLVADAYTQKLLHPVRSFWHGLKAVGDVFVEALEAHAYWP